MFAKRKKKKEEVNMSKITETEKPRVVRSRLHMQAKDKVSQYEN